VALGQVIVWAGETVVWPDHEAGGDAAGERFEEIVEIRANFRAVSGWEIFP